MRPRYSKYFLSHVLWLKDPLNTYYVQDRFCNRRDMFGITLKTFFDHRAAVTWLKQCTAFDHMTRHKLRKFLSQSAPRPYYQLFRWNDVQVMDEVARTIMRYRYPVVIRPLYEKPRRASATIDIVCAVQNGAPPVQIAESPVLTQARQTLQQALDNQKQTDDNAKDKKTTTTPGTQYTPTPQMHQAANRITLLPHTPKDWQAPDTTGKVLLNAVKLLGITAPDIVNHYPLDTLITGAVDDFTKTVPPPWPTPQQTEQLLAAHIEAWIRQKDRKRPAVLEGTAPQKSSRENKKSFITQPSQLHCLFVRLYRQDGQSRKRLYLKAGYNMTGPKKMEKKNNFNRYCSLTYLNTPAGSYSLTFKGFSIEHASLDEEIKEEK